MLTRFKHLEVPEYRSYSLKTEAARSEVFSLLRRKGISFRLFWFFDSVVDHSTLIPHVEYCRSDERQIVSHWDQIFKSQPTYSIEADRFGDFRRSDMSLNLFFFLSIQVSHCCLVWSVLSTEASSMKTRLKQLANFFVCKVERGHRMRFPPIHRNLFALIVIWQWPKAWLHQKCSYKTLSVLPNRRNAI